MKLLLMALVSASFLAWLFFSGTAATLLDALQSLDSALVAVLVAGLMLSYVLRALRVYTEFGAATQGRFSACLRVVLMHNALVNLLPMRSGEFAFPLLLQRQFGVPLERSVSSLLWLRLQDAFVLAALALLMWPNLTIALRGGLLLGLLITGGCLPRLAQALLARLHHPRWRRLASALAESSHHARMGWVWTSANWSLKLSILAWGLARVLQTVFGVGFAGAVGGELAALFPVQGVAGFGSYEAGVAAALSVQQVPFAQGLVAAFSLHVVVLGSAVTCGAVAALCPTLLPLTRMPALIKQKFFFKPDSAEVSADPNAK